jgi:hypothetical protein
VSNYIYYPKMAPEVAICGKSPDGRHRFEPPKYTCDWCEYGGVVIGNEVLYVPTEKGREYHLRTEPNVLLFGGRGSAKSTTGRWDAHMRALAYPGFNYIILRRTFPQLDDSHLRYVPREMKLLGGTYNNTKHIAYYPNGSTGTFRHCATEEDVLNLLSSEFALAFFDEISTFEWEQFTKLSASVRVPVGSGLRAMVRAATNPLGPSAQMINQYWVDKDVAPEDDPDYIPSDWYAIKANAVDNPYLDREQYKKRMSGLADHVRRAWLDGDFVLENALFNFAPTLDGKPYHVTPDIDLKKVLQDAVVYRAIDNGWFPDPTVVLWIAHLGNRHIVFNELTKTKTIAADMCELIKAEDRRLGVKNVVTTYCDPTMDTNTTADVRTIREIYEANGIPMECSINKRDVFATVMHEALASEAYEGTPGLQIYANGKQGCPSLVKTIPQMRYDEKRPLFMADHHNDHWVIALCYYLMSHASDPRRFGGTGGSQLRPWMKPKAHEYKPLGWDQVRDRH